MAHEGSHSVYVITFLPNGKKYVGMSKDAEERFKSHCWSLASHKHPCKLLQYEWDKYKATMESVQVEILEEGLSYDEAVEQERATMVLLKTYDDRYGYNGRDPRMRSERIEHGLAVRNMDYVRRKKKRKKESTAGVSLSRFRNLDVEQLKFGLTDMAMARIIGKQGASDFRFSKRHGLFEVDEIKKMCAMFDCNFEYLFEEKEV